MTNVLKEYLLNIYAFVVPSFSGSLFATSSLISKSLSRISALGVTAGVASSSLTGVSTKGTLPQNSVILK
ncbi:hypothetical protein D3C80_1087950 [compost metagenome]